MEQYLERLRTSTTLYVGNASFYTTEEQIWAFFEKAGPVKTIVMGLDKIKKTPCGFCFVEYHGRDDAERAVKYLNGTKLDDRDPSPFPSPSARGSTSAVARCPVCDEYRAPYASRRCIDDDGRR